MKIRIISIFVIINTFLIFNLFSDNILNKYKCNSTWDKADTVLMHIPGSETFWAGIFPIASGYTSSFNQQNAINEFKTIIDTLKNAGIKVKTSDEIILSGITDNTGQVIPDAPLFQLQDFAKGYLNINCKHLKAPLTFDLDSYKKHVISRLSPQNLLKIIFLNPTVELHQEADFNLANNFLSPKFIPKPLVNFFYIDSLAITTNKGIVIGNPSNPQRKAEKNVIKLLMSRLVVQPIYEVKGNATLEGGDYIPAGDIIFLGQGLRTNKKGIKHLIDNKVFSTNTVVVVKDNLKLPKQMHLNKYFNVLTSDTVVFSEHRMQDEKRPKADIYKFNISSKQYSLRDKAVDFIDFTTKNLGFKIIPVSYEDINNMATGFFLIKNNLAIMPQGLSDEYKNAIEKAGVKAIYIDVENIKSGGGNISDVIQILNRNQEKTTRKHTSSDSGGHL